MRSIAILLLFLLFCGFLFLVSSADSGSIPFNPFPKSVDSGPDLDMITRQLQAVDRLNNAELELAAVATLQAIHTANAVESAALRDQQATQQAAVATAQAQATREAVAWSVIQLTAEADRAISTATAQANATWFAVTATSVQYSFQQTVEAGAYIDRVRMRADRRQEQVNNVLAWLPYASTILFACAILSAGAVAIYRLSRAPQVIKRDSRGDAPILYTRHNQVIDPDLAPSAVIEMTPGAVAAPPLAAADVQERVTARAQSVDLFTRGLPGQPAANSSAGSRPRVQDSFNPPVPPPGPRIILIPAHTVPPELVSDPAKAEALDVAWREEVPA